MTEERQEHQEEKPRGFIDKEEWVAMGRNEEDWRDPDEFKRRGDEILPIVKKERDDLRDQIAQMREDITTFVKTQEDLTLRKEKDAYNRAKAEYEDKISQLKAMKREAVRIGDEDAYERAEQQEERLKPPQEPQVTTQPAGDKDYETWRKDNPWWESDPVLTRYARSASVDIQQRTGLAGRALYDEVTKDVKQNFPHKFENTRRNEPPPVADGAPASRNGRKKTERDLPKEAKDAINRFMRMNPKLSRDRLVDGYLNQYFPEGA